MLLTLGHISYLMGKELPSQNQVTSITRGPTINTGRETHALHAPVGCSQVSLLGSPLCTHPLWPFPTHRDAMGNLRKKLFQGHKPNTRALVLILLFSGWIILCARFTATEVRPAWGSTSVVSEPCQFSCKLKTASKDVHLHPRPNELQGATAGSWGGISLSNSARRGKWCICPLV